MNTSVNVTLIAEYVGIAAAFVSVIIFLYKLSTSNVSIIRLLKKIIEKLDTTSSFQAEVKRDMAEFQKESERYEHIHTADTKMLAMIYSDLKSNSEDHKYFIRLFDDLKGITIDTNQTLNKMTTAIDRLSTIIEMSTLVRQ